MKFKFIVHQSLKNVEMIFFLFGASKEKNERIPFGISGCLNRQQGRTVAFFLFSAKLS